MGNSGLGVFVVTLDVLANGLIHADLSNQGSVDVVLACVDEEALERGLAVLGKKLETEKKTFFMKPFNKKISNSVKILRLRNILSLQFFQVQQSASDI